MKTVLLSVQAGDAESNATCLAEACREIQSVGKGELVLSDGVFPVANAAGDSLFSRLMSGQLDPRGVYAKNPAIFLQNISGLTIDGAGATLRFRGLVQPMMLQNCWNVTIKNLTIEWERPLYSEGTVVLVGRDFLEFKVDDFSAFDVSAGVASFHDLDPVTGRLAGVCVFGGIPPFEEVRPMVYRIRHSQCGFSHVGARLVVRHLYNFASALEMNGCTGVRVEDLTILGNPGPGIHGGGSRDLSFRRLIVRPPQGRAMSTLVDATHFKSCSGLIDFEDCHFEGMGDDAVNVNTRYHFAIRRLSPCEVLMEYRGKAADREGELPRVGCVLEFVKPQTLKAYGEGVLKERVEESSGKTYRLIFDRDLPEEFVEDDLIVLASDLAELRFVNCTCRNIRGRGVLAQTRGVLIEGCEFDHCTGQGIHVDTSAGWWEAIGARDVVIRSNRFCGCGYGRQTYCDAAGVVVETECAIPAAGVHRGLLIENNRIDGSGDIPQFKVSQPGILVTCTDGALVRGNTISNCSPAVHIAFSENVSVTDTRPPESEILVGGTVNRKGEAFTGAPSSAVPIC